MPSDELIEFLETQGYSHVRRLENGVCIGIGELIFTSAVYYGLSYYGWKKRWCFSTLSEAIESISEWDGEGDPPGCWVAKRGFTA